MQEISGAGIYFCKLEGTDTEPAYFGTIKEIINKNKVKKKWKEYTKCGIVLDITNRKIDQNECIKVIEDRASDRCMDKTEIIIKEKIIKILRVKK